VLEQKWRKQSAIDVINLVLGAGLTLAPWVFGFASVERASRNALVAGAMIGIVAIIALAALAEWEEWINLLLGLWVAISPWALGFHLAISEAAVRIHVALGLVVAVLAAVQLWLVRRARPRITA
jgi:predicted MFS family arabinose efflux permease